MLDSLVRVSRRVEENNSKTIHSARQVTPSHKTKHDTTIKCETVNTTLLHTLCLERILKEAFKHPKPIYHAPESIPNTSSRWHTLQEASHVFTHKPRSTNCICVTGHKHHTWQSHDIKLIPSAFLSASSGTFNFLFNVLFIFPSGYLYSIDFERMFSFSWKLPANLRSNPEKHDSWKAYRAQGSANDKQDYHHRWYAFPSGLQLYPH